jgi:hypothetical protein
VKGVEVLPEVVEALLPEVEEAEVVAVVVVVHNLLPVELPRVILKKVNLQKKMKLQQSLSVTKQKVKVGKSLLEKKERTDHHLIKVQNQLHLTLLLLLLVQF